jgi:hypothetical protein
MKNSIMMGKMYALLIGALGIVGLFVSGHLFKLMNVDIALDALRIVLAAYLVYAAFIAKNVKMTANGLLAVGILYLAMAVWGLFSSTLGGILPSGLTGFDIVFHLVTGIVAVAAGMHHSEAHHGNMAHAA